MGSIRLRPNGRYQVQVRRKGQRTLTKTFPTKVQARAWEREQEVQMDNGNIVSLSNAGAHETLVNDLLDVYEREHVDHKRKSDAAAVERVRVRTLERAFKGVTFKECDYKRLVQWGRERRKQVSSDSLVRELGVLSSAFNHAKYVNDFPMGANPVTEAKTVMRRMKIIEKPARRERVISDTEMDRLYADLKKNNPNVLAAVQFALEMAMRRGELAKLRWSDVNTDTQELRLRDTKAGKDQKVPLTLRASLILAAVPMPKPKPGEEPEEDPLVFGLQPHSITTAFRRACKRCGIEDLRVHDLRHSAASRWVASGLNIAEVRLLTRHKSLDTLGRYLHADVNTVREKMDSLEREK